jgi:hypothetical protein
MGVLVTLYFIVYQQIENYVLVPRVMRNAVNLSDAVVIVEVWLRERVQHGDRSAEQRMREEEGS